jgi:quaternary ammonium compound-resistance protein SugE
MRNAAEMSWVYLLIAGVLEITWPPLLKQSDGFTRLGPTLTMFGVGAASFYFFSLSLRTIPVGTGYAVWTGMGAAGAALLGMLYYGEPRTAARLVCIALIIAGIVGLKLLMPDAEKQPS